MTKYFIITVDTEGEGGWSWQPGTPISTENSLYIERFQELCDRFHFPPVYLTNWEMINEPRFVEKAIEWEKDGRCEIGIHVHAWSNPPEYKLNRVYSGTDYLIEYPEEIMREKFKILYNQIRHVVGHPPYTHRAGRWAMDERYFKILEEYEILVDCSFTPGISWKNNVGATIGGTDYSNSLHSAHYIGSILEVPMSVKRMHTWGRGSYKHKLKGYILGKNVWLRPAGNLAHEMIDLIKEKEKSGEADYVEFMIHSNELMPGGSPYFKTSEDIEQLYKTMEKVFAYAKTLGYEGVTLHNYYRMKNESKDF